MSKSRITKEFVVQMEEALEERSGSDRRKLKSAAENAANQGKRSGQDRRSNKAEANQ